MTACPCIVAATLHEGHCCPAEIPDDWHIGDDHCHKAEWDAVRERERAAREGTVDD